MKALWLLLAAPLLWAQIPGTFRQIDIDGGGWFTGMVQHSSGRIYGRTDVGGVYRTDDAGESWTFLGGDFTSPGGLFPQGIAVAKGDADVIYQATGTSYANSDPNRGIWKSSNGGDSWMQVRSGLNFSGNDAARHGGECLIIHPDNDSEVWAGSRGDGLWRSTNAGATWTEMGNFQNTVIVSVYIHPSFPNQIWVGTEGGLWMSWNRGATWQRRLDVDVIYRVVRKSDGSGFAIGGNYQGSATQLWHITKGDWFQEGQPTFTGRWSNYLDAHQAAFGWRPAETAAMLTILRDGRLVTAPMYRRFGVSSDNGASFALLSDTVQGEIPVWAWAPPQPFGIVGGSNQLMQDVSDDNRWFVTGGYGPGRTDDGGSTWKFMTEGIGEVVGWRPCFHPTKPDVVMLPVADHGMTTVQDGGLTGETVGTVSRHFPWPNDILTWAHGAAATGDRIIALGGDGLGDQARVWRSTNNGGTWTRLAANGYPQVDGHPFVEMVADRENPDDILGLIGGSIGNFTGGIYHSTDGGVSFSQSPLPGDANGYNAGSEFVWFTRLRADGGNLNRRYLSLKNRGIYRSDDKGANWSKLNPQGLPNVDGWIGVDHKKANRLWFGSFNGLFRSDDGGENFSSISGFTQAVDVDAVDGHVVVTGRRTGDNWTKIYYSADDGVSWDEVTRPGYRFGNVLGVAVDPWRPERVWISTNGRSYAIFTPDTALAVDEWQQDAFGGRDGLAAPDEDPDQDGLTNFMEYALGTDPLVGNGAPGQLLGSGGFSIDRPRRPDVVYRGEASEDLFSWNLPVSTTNDDAQNLTFEVFSSLEMVFFRLAVEPME